MYFQDVGYVVKNGFSKILWIQRDLNFVHSLLGCRNGLYPIERQRD